MKPLFYTQTEIDHICSEFFREIQENHFQVKLTVGGSPCIIISRAAGGSRPIMGVYFTGDEWIPVKWDINGKYISKEHPRKLDLDLDLDT